jgi:predicted DNA-binding protein
MSHTTKAAQIGPMAVQLEVEFLDRLSEPVRDKKAKSVSEIIRTALERYDFTHMVVVRTAHVTISVRLPVELRRTLKKTARAKHTSIGQLVRTAVEAYLPQLEAETAGQLEMPIQEKTAKASAKSGEGKPAKKKSGQGESGRVSPVKSKGKPKAKASANTAGHKSGRGAKPAPQIMTKKRKA